VPAVRIFTSYEDDTKAGAEVLLAVLRRSLRASDPAPRSSHNPGSAADLGTTTPRPDEKDSATP
jgi:hypothetical protein